MDPIIQPLLQYGVLGIFAVLLILFVRDLMKKQDTRFTEALKREQDRGDALSLENIRLNNLIQERVIPAMTAGTQAIVQMTSLLQSLQYQRDVEAAAAKGKP